MRHITGNFKLKTLPLVTNPACNSGKRPLSVQMTHSRLVSGTWLESRLFTVRITVLITHNLWWIYNCCSPSGEHQPSKGTQFFWTFRVRRGSRSRDNPVRSRQRSGNRGWRQNCPGCFDCELHTDIGNRNTDQTQQPNTLSYKQLLLPVVSTCLAGLTGPSTKHSLGVNLGRH